MTATASQTFAAANSTTPDYGPELLPQHAKLLADSAISPTVAASRGYRSATVKADLRRLGFSDPQCNVPALLLPIRDVSGEIATYQVRPDTPRIGNGGRAIKYDSPRGGRLVLDVPPSVRAQLGNPEESLWITEGARKVDSAISQGLCCIGVMGVFGWRGKNDLGGVTALADWESIALKGRTVYLCFDSDAWTNPNVIRALRRLSRFLESKSAAVNIVRLPAAPEGGKVGLDDFFATGKTTLDLFECVVDGGLPDSQPADDGEPSSGPYEVQAGQICYRKRERDGDVSMPLCNFVARIVGEDVTDDGQTTAAELLIAGRLADGAPLPSLHVPTRRFASLDWVSEWGARAVITAGMGNRDRLREAIQRLSPDIPRRHVYTHPGWAKLDGVGWAYLHADGAIAAAGPGDGVTVRLSAPTDHISLPDPPTGDDLIAAVRLALGTLTVAPDRITVPLLGAIFRAPLTAMQPADTTIGEVGESGTLKTELAALAQRFFGEAFDRTLLPASWSGTANALERIAFDYKDALCVIDDFAPSGTSYEINRYHQTAERIIRGAGNVAGRHRMNADGSLRAAFAPRGLLLFTGEDVPRGHSIRARTVLIEVERGDVDQAALRTYQAGLGRAAPSRAMAGYLQWIAARYDELATTLPDELVSLRTDFSAAALHARTPEALANLLLGWRIFLRFTVDVGAFGVAEAEDLTQRLFDTLTGLAAVQAAHHADERPAERFLALVRAALVKGEAHVASMDGDAPVRATAWGWRERTLGTGDFLRQEWQPQGARIGWVDGDDLYLEPRAAFSVAQRLGMSSGDTVAVTLPTLNKRLHQAGYLKTTEQGVRQTLTARKTIGGSRQTVLHLAAFTLLGKPDQPDPNHGPQPAGRAGTAASGQAFRSGFGENGKNSTKEPDHQPHRPDKKPLKTWANLANTEAAGRNGRIGQVLEEDEDYAAEQCRKELEQCWCCKTWKPRGGVCPVCHPPAASWGRQ